MPLSIPTLTSIVRSVLLTEADDPAPSYNRAAFARAVRETFYPYADKESQENMRLVAVMIADPALNFASYESLASLIVAGGLYRHSGRSSPEEWGSEAARLWKRFLPKNDSDHLRKAIVNEIERRAGAGAAGQDDREEMTVRETHKLRTLTPSEMAAALENHSLWISSGGGAYKNSTKKGERANFDSVDFKGAHLTWAKLGRAILSHADFTGAYLRRVNLSGADLTGAILSGANLQGANLMFAHLDDADLTGALYDSKTIFTRGFDPAARGMVLVPPERV